MTAALRANSSLNVLSTSIGILDSEDYNFYWQTEEIGISIHTSYPPPPISARISAFHKGSPSAHWGGGAEPPCPPLGYATEFLPFKVSDFQFVRQD